MLFIQKVLIPGRYQDKTKQNKKPSGVINYLREQRGSVHFDKSKNLTRQF